jgi:hypothetical protein
MGDTAVKRKPHELREGDRIVGHGKLLGIELINGHWIAAFPNDGYAKWDSQAEVFVEE